MKAVIGGLIVLALGLLAYAMYKPPLPVSVSWRAALLNRTNVCVLNLSEGQPSPLRVQVVYRDNSLNETKKGYVDLKPGSNSIGHLDGFPILAGDTLEFSNAHYSTLKVTCPGK